MKKTSLLLVIIVLLITGCSRGKFIIEEQVTLRVLSKDKINISLFLMDETTRDMFDLSVSNHIFSSVEMDNLIDGTKKVYKDSNGDLKAYYTINTTMYNAATYFELRKAKEVIVENVEVVVKDKYSRKKFNAATKTSTTYYYVVYKEEGSSYVVSETLSSSVYNTIHTGDTLLAEKNTYTLQDDRVVERLRLVKVTI